MVEKKHIVHYVVDSWMKGPACGVGDWKYETNSTEATTCKSCLKSIERKKREGEKNKC